MHTSKPPRRSQQRLAVRIAAAAVASTALLGMSAGPAMAGAQHSRPHTPAAHRSAKPPAPPPVPQGWARYYIVGAHKGSSSQVFYELAVKRLSNGDLGLDVFQLGESSSQPEGGDVIKPGWILALPANGSVPGALAGPQAAAAPQASGASATSQGTHAAGSPASGPGTAGGPRHSAVGSAASRPARLAWAAGIGGVILVGLLVAMGLLIRRRSGNKRAAQPDRVLALTASGGGAVSGGAVSGGAVSGGAVSGGAVSGGAGSGGGATAQQRTVPQPVVTGVAEPSDVCWPDYLLQAEPQSAALAHQGAVRPAVVRPAVIHHAAGSPSPDGPPIASPVPADPVAVAIGSGRTDPVDRGAVRSAASWPVKALSPVALRMLGAPQPDGSRPGTADVPAQRHHVALGDDRIEVVLAKAPAVSHEDSPGSGHARLASSPYLVWAPLPYDIPDNGVAFACLGTGDEGSLFIDLAAAPGAIAIGGDDAASVRLAESIVHQLAMTMADEASPRRTVIVAGSAVPEPLPAGVTQVTTTGDLAQAGAVGRGDAVAIVFCELRSDEDAFALARYMGSAQHRVIPVVLAGLPDAPWSFTARPSPHPGA